jgi:hypothetical protein
MNTTFELVNAAEIVKDVAVIDRPMILGILNGLAMFEEPMPKLEFEVSDPGANHYVINVKGFIQPHDYEKFGKTFVFSEYRESKYDNIEQVTCCTVGVEKQQLCLKIRVRKSKYKTMKRGK